MTDFAMMCCGDCGIEFQVPSQFYRERKETGKTWYCPNGHSRVFRESDADKYRREAERLKQQAAQKDDEIKWQREQRELAERRLSAAKGQITKIRKRVGHGVCPCCNRTFENLNRHMASKHPDYADNIVEFKA